MKNYGLNILGMSEVRWREFGEMTKQTWRRSVHSEALGEGKGWGEVKQLAEIVSDGNVLLMPYVPKRITGYDDDDEEDSV